MALFESGIRPAVDKWLLDKAAEVRDYKDYWSASSAGYCMRRVIFERLGVPKVESDGDARKQRVFTSGHIFHQWIQGITKEAGLSIAQELELQDENLMIRGHIDDLVLVPRNRTPQETRWTNAIEKDDGTFEYVGGGANPTGMVPVIGKGDHLILYDYKSQSSRAFSYKRPDMSHYHKLQLGTYMYMLRSSPHLFARSDTYGGEPLRKIKDTAFQMDTKNLTEARILKISKDDLRMVEEQLMWSPQLEKEVVGYWSTLNGYWKARKIPKCTCADYEGGFLAKEAWNGYYFDGEPCSIKLYERWKQSAANINPGV